MPKKTSGLTNREVKNRLDQYGPNEIERQQKVVWLSVLVSQFKSPLIYILFFAGLLSLVLGELIDAGVIFLAVVVNTGLGFFQEYKSEKALESLRGIVKPKAVVLRGGGETGN
jgi:P-type Ca2+ transporter type 2C